MAGAAPPAAPGGMLRTQHTPSTVLCCLCGTPMQPNATGMCLNCIRTNIDITEGLQKHLTVLFCPECGRYLNPPRAWVKAAPESKELLAFCIKRIKNLSKVRLVDASFIWTEPHSKRLKVKLTIQKEAMASAILQQSFVAEYVVEDHMCDACSRLAANPDQWVAVAQVRQKAEHRRTFFFLEQLILKHGADQACINIKQMHDGVDFFFSNRSHALKFVDFMNAVIPIQFRTDKQLVSHDTHTNSYNYKFTFSVEIAPICKDDLICLPPKAAAALGNIGPLVVCIRVSNNMALMDPNTLRVVYLDANQYWRYAFQPLMSSRSLVEYVVLDAERVHGAQSTVNFGQPRSQPGTPMSAASSSFNPFGPSRGAKSVAKYQLSDVQIARVSDFGKNDTIFSVRTHLGHLLKPGDFALGYDLFAANLNSQDLDSYRALSIPDAVLVRKSYEEKRRKRRGRARPWKLKELPMELDVGPAGGAGTGRGSGATRGGGAAALEKEREALEKERFMDEVEEDPDLRSRIAVYQNTEYEPAMSEGGEEGDGEEPPEIPIEELLSELTLEGAGAAAEEGEGERDEMQS